MVPRARTLTLPSSPKRLAFLGSPEVAATTLRAVHARGHEIVLVVSGSDRRRGRGSGTSPTPVKAAALDLGIPVSERVADVVDAGVDLGVVVAFGRLIRPEVLARVPMINVHYSLLPRWRGAAPVERAILAGDDETGVCIMGLEEGLDTGPIYERASVPIDGREHAETLRNRLGVLGSALLLDVLDSDLAAIEATAQSGEATYAAKITQDELHLDWREPALLCHRRVRIGRAWTSFRGRRLVVCEAHPVTNGGVAIDVGQGTLNGDVVATSLGGLVLVEVQAEGKSPQPFSTWALGARPEPGERLGD